MISKVNGRNPTFLWITLLISSFGTRQSLKNQGYTVQEAELRWIPNNLIEVIDLDQARKLLKLMDALEDLDDIQSVTANFDMNLELLTAAIA